VLLTIPVPVMAGLSLIYFYTVFYPVTAGAERTRRALANTRQLLHRYSGSSGAVGLTKLVQNLNQHVITPLKQALELDPGNASIYLDLAKSQWRIWTLKLDEKDASREAVYWAERAILVDPESREGYQAVYDLREIYARRKEYLVVPARLGMVLGGASQEAYVRHQRETSLEYQENLKKAKEQYRFAAEALERYLVMDPWNVEVHFRVAEAWFHAGDLERARQQALKALVKNNTVHPARKLTEAQREQLTRWMQGAPAP
jgi:tetratricopeptide (TPR) repeat protein